MLHHSHDLSSGREDDGEVSAVRRVVPPITREERRGRGTRLNEANGANEARCRGPKKSSVGQVEERLIGSMVVVLDAARAGRGGGVGDGGVGWVRRKEPMY